MSDLFQSILRGEPSAELDQQFPFCPLTSPGMPAPGESFIAAAAAMDGQMPVVEGSAKSRRLVSHGPALHYLYRRALYDEQFKLSVKVKGQPKTASFVPGHLLGSDTKGMSGGPMPAKVMVIGKNPGRDELQWKRNFVGSTSSVFFDALDQLNVGEAERGAWYVTNLVKWASLDAQSDNTPEAHRKDCALLLEQEIRLVKPDFILCLGSDASKWLTQLGVQSLVGRCIDYWVPTHATGEVPQQRLIKVMGLTHPAQIYRRPEGFEEFKNQLGLFLSLTNGANVGGKEEGLNHRDIYKADDLEAIVKEIRSDPDPLRRIIAVDGEWHGDHPTEPGAYLRTIQFSSKHGEGINVVLRHQGGSQAFQPSIEHAIKLLNRLLKYDRDAGWMPQVGGHFFRADLPWLLHAGLDLREEYAPAETPAAMRDNGGWETGLAYHAVNEATSYRLTDMQVRLTTAPVYDNIVKDAVTEFCKQQDITKDNLEGYGFIPWWKLHGYGAYDSDVVRRILIKLYKPGGLLDCDWFGNSSWEPYWIAHRASLGVLEMEMTGLYLDKKRVDELSSLYEYVFEKLLASFREKINWCDKVDEKGKIVQKGFNPNSSPQAVAFLFGDQYGRKVDKDSETGFRSCRPPEAVTLNLTPIKTTGKRSKLWADVVARRETKMFNPSSDKESLGILGHAHPLAMQLRDLKFIAQILKGALRRPNRIDDGTPEIDDEGNQVYAAGLPSFVHSDGFVRTHISQNKETGRYASARPPLQAMANRRESDYGRILGTRDETTGKYRGDYESLFPEPLYEHPVRSIFRAPPSWKDPIAPPLWDSSEVTAEPCVLVGADYKGAELAALAWLSGDPTFIEHVRRNCLDEKTDPDFFDIHSAMAVRCFHLECAPTKKGLKAIGRIDLRVAAKNIVFGTPYQRSAEAIARQCREEGVQVSVDDCQKIIDFYFQLYVRVGPFLDACKERSQSQCWMANAYGRFRRFIHSRERSVTGDQERQACNFDIQSTVADAVSTAIRNFTEIRRELPGLRFRLALQMHDALEFVVPVKHLYRFCVDDKDASGNITRPSVLRECMVNRVPVWPRTIDNKPMAVSAPYHFGIDSEIYLNWGETLTAEQATQLGLDPTVLGL